MRQNSYTKTQSDARFLSGPIVLARPVFQNGWVDRFPSNQRSGYGVIAGSLVLVSINANGTAATTSTIFTLPIGFRPSGDVRFPAFNGVGSVASIDINADGTVVVSPWPASTFAFGQFLFSLVGAP